MFVLKIMQQTGVTTMIFSKMKFEFSQQLNSPETLNIRIYGDVEPDNYNPFTGETKISTTSQNYFAEQLDKYSNVKQINLYINSAGGYVDQGYGIYANLKRHPAHKTCYIDGFANSIASIIALACDKIIMYSNSVMGIHNMRIACFGNAVELRKTADYLDKMMDGNREIYLQRSNGKITPEKLIELLDNETVLTANECVEYGFCDEIVGTPAPNSNKNDHIAEPKSENNSANNTNINDIAYEPENKPVDIFACIAKSLII